MDVGDCFSCLIGSGKPYLVMLEALNL